MNEDKRGKSLNTVCKILMVSKTLACGKTLFGGIKINDYQLGFAWGMCERFAQISGQDTEETSLAFIVSAFSSGFGENDSPKLIGRVLKKQEKFLPYILEGGNSVDLWIQHGAKSNVALLLPLPDMKPGQHYSEMSDNWK